MDKSKTIDVTSLTAEQERALLAELGGLKMGCFLLTPELYAQVVADSEQTPTSRCLPDHLKGSLEYSGPAIIKTSMGLVAITIDYLFDAAELAAAGDDEGNLPWDYAHVEAERSTIIGF